MPCRRVDPIVGFKTLDAGGTVCLFFMGREARRKIERAFQVDATAVVEIYNDVGSVSIEGSEGQKVWVQAIARAWGSILGPSPQRQLDEIKVEMTQKNSHIYITGRVPQHLLQRRSPCVDMILRVPRQCDLVLDDNVGSVEINNLRGAFQIQVKAGNIKALHISPDRDSSFTVDVGNIAIAMPRDSSFQLRASAQVGSINCAFEVRGARDHPFGPGAQVEGQVGGHPSVRLNLRARVGAITLKGY